MKHTFGCLGLMILSLTLLGCRTMSGDAGSPPAKESKMVDFKIAGGQTVKCPITDSGPLPAEGGPYRVEEAGLAMGRDESGEHTFLIRTFGITVGRGGTPSHITVEDVTDDTAVLMVDDKDPKIVKGYWKGHASPLTLSEDSTPWIFDDKPTIKIYRITISAKNTPDVILYQPSWYAAQVKRSIAQWAKKKS